MTDRVRDLAKIVAFSAVYVAVARMGLMLDAVAGFATLVWPPTGISLAALVCFGPRLWPGVAIGALVTNLWAGAPLPVALGIAVGNTLEAVAGAYALDRWGGFRRSLDQLRDVLGLVVLGAFASTTLSATVGVVSLLVGGIITVERFAETFRAWWIGDLIADLVVAPVFLVWSAPRSPHDPPRRTLERVSFGAVVVLLSVLIYQSAPGVEGGMSVFRQSYVSLPILIWAALRFGQRETVTTTLVVAAIAIFGTAMGHGPFASPSLHQSLFSLQTFMGVSAATFLVLGASMSERRQAAADLRATQKELETAVQARDALISIASHELRTPLSPLQLHVHAIARRLARGSKEDLSVDALTSRIATIDRQVMRLTRLIDNLLDVSRITAGKLQLEYEDLDLVETVREVVVRFHDELRRSGQSVSIEAQGEVVGRWDRMRIEQIATNLISNAIKYGARRPIEIAIGGDDANALLSVRDHGIGIAEKDRARIFERFERLLSVTHTGGFGLGLWIVREIVQALGGTIRVESEVGTGSTFTVELPKQHQQ